MTPSSFRDPAADAAEREWLKQERATREERLGTPPPPGDSDMRRYRLLARALSEPLDAELPERFAQEVAACIEAGEQARRAAASRFEAALIVVLAALGVVLAGAAMVLAAPAGVRALALLRPGGNLSWLIALACCLAASGAWRWRASP